MAEQSTISNPDTPVVQPVTASTATDQPPIHISAQDALVFARLATVDAPRVEAEFTDEGLSLNGAKGFVERLALAHQADANSRPENIKAWLAKAAKESNVIIDEMPSDAELSALHQQGVASAREVSGLQHTTKGDMDRLEKGLIAASKSSEAISFIAPYAAEYADKDHDGKISPEEQQAFRDELEKWRKDPTFQAADKQMGGMGTNLVNGLEKVDLNQALQNQDQLAEQIKAEIPKLQSWSNRNLVSSAGKAANAWINDEVANSVASEAGDPTKDDAAITKDVEGTLSPALKQTLQDLEYLFTKFAMADHDPAAPLPHPTNGQVVADQSAAKGGRTGG